MAVWQFDLAFAHGSAKASWHPSSRSDVMHYLASRVGPSTPMLEGWRYFGDEAHNCIDMVSDPDGHYELHARLDACATETDHFIDVVCDVAHALGCEFFSVELAALLPPRSRALKDALQRSTAWRFALDPEGFDTDA
ncbi:hypothetical protein FHT39_002600 [Mitsuaria sp. BK045]|jgi:hypothetical protein|uniref:hypothetical protein n=1 Tax=unclassified Roseateles TaxID=2626991 RepID=UPI001610E58F|nr:MULTISPECIES: hypothetical protein [unclassified Roseateles]MBB3293961.1 hypothetical protein [Mitsuaria sp. BK041]MBB3363178.1 hypothetical protein [Mitsuaria sp. BK045]